MAIAPAFVHRERARRCTGTFHIRFRRGGGDYTYRLEDGLLAVEAGRPDAADFHIIAGPVAYLLVSLGRMSRIRAGSTLKMFGYGWKPWLLLPLGRIRVDGV